MDITELDLGGSSHEDVKIEKALTDIFAHLETMTDESGHPMFATVRWHLEPSQNPPIEEATPEARIKLNTESLANGSTNAAPYNQGSLVSIYVTITSTGGGNIPLDLQWIRFLHRVVEKLYYPDSEVTGEDGLVPEGCWQFDTEKEWVIDYDSGYPVKDDEADIQPPMYVARIDLPIWYFDNPALR